MGQQMDFLPMHPPRGVWVFRWTFSSPPHHQLFVPTQPKKAQVLFLPGQEKLKFLFLGGGGRGSLAVYAILFSFFSSTPPTWPKRGVKTNTLQWVGGGGSGGEGGARGRGGGGRGGLGGFPIKKWGSNFFFTLCKG